MPRRSYPTDVINAQRAILESLVLPGNPGGRSLKHPPRELVDAMLYLLRDEISRRLLLHDLPPWLTGFGYFRIWRGTGTGGTSTRRCGSGCG
jgi:transposase